MEDKSTNIIWKDIIGFEGRYKISNDGQVYNIKRRCYIKGSLVSKGYWLITIVKNGSLKKFYIHRLVATHFIPNPENKPQVNHINGIMRDNRVDNLEWNTAKENIMHAYATGLVPTEIKVKQGARLSENEVMQIRSSNKSTKQLAEDFKMSCTNIRCIILRQTWKHI